MIVRVHELLGQMVNLVQTRETSIGHDELVVSEIILPSSTLTMEEVQALLRHDSLLDNSAPTSLGL